MSDNARNKGRSAIYAMAGFYLIYMAYQIFKNRADSAGGEYVAVMIAAVAFALVGGAMILFGLYNFYKIGKEMHDISSGRPEITDEEK